MDFHTDYFFFVFEMFKFMCYNKNQKKKSFYNFIISITQASTIVNLRWNIEIIDMAGSFVRKGDKSVKTDREDQRTRITKKLIRESFLALLSRKDIRHITVRELCETAQINRGTFYKYYLDVYDLKEQIENEFLQEFSDSVNRFARSGALDSVYEVCRTVFALLKENAELCRILLGRDANDGIIDKFVKIGRDIFISVYPGMFPKKKKKKLERYYLFISGGCVVSVRKWILSGMNETVEEMAREISGIMTEGVGYLSEKNT